MNSATHGTEGSASVLVLYMSLELSNSKPKPDITEARVTSPGRFPPLGRWSLCGQFQPFAGRLFDHAVGAHEDRSGDLEPERLRCFEINYQPHHAPVAQASSNNWLQNRGVPTQSLSNASVACNAVFDFKEENRHALQTHHRNPCCCARLYICCVYICDVVHTFFTHNLWIISQCRHYE